MASSRKNRGLWTPNGKSTTVDYYAARVRDYGLEDAATYEQRVKQGAQMQENLIGSRADYQKSLDAAANRGANQAKGKEGPER